eukprot:15366299-Ditylum_brightwellii.AAC.1
MLSSLIKKVLKRKRMNAILQSAKARELARQSEMLEKIPGCYAMAGADCSRNGSMFWDIQNNF